MALPATKARVSPQEYLRLEEAAEIKHEYHAGEVLAMSGGSYRHSRITANAIRELGGLLKGSPCFVLESNMRLRLASVDRYVYPDLSVVCGKPQFDPLDENQTTIINPKVIIEVLSASTAAYDRGDKFEAYQSLKSFEEYILIFQDRPRIETFTRQSGSTWLMDAVAGIDAAAKIRSLQIDLPLAEIYAGIDFEAPSDAAALGG